MWEMADGDENQETGEQVWICTLLLFEIWTIDLSHCAKRIMWKLMGGWITIFLGTVNWLGRHANFGGEGLRAGEDKRTRINGHQLGYRLAQSPCDGEGPGPRAATADGDLSPRRTVARHRTRMNSKAPIYFLSNSPDRALHFTDSSNSSISMKQDNLVQENQARIRVNIAAISIWTNPNKDMVLPKQDPTT